MPKYHSPLETRYASDEMLTLFSDENRFLIWRKIWTALAKAQHELGLPISREQITEMEANLENIDFKRAAEIEREIHHDVMSHIRAFGEVAPQAQGIIHLGATSEFINGNTDMILYRDALNLVKRRLVTLIHTMKNKAMEYRNLPILGYTHLQPAQPTTLGKRISLWLYDLIMDFEDLQFRLDRMITRGAKGTTGTQASFLKLFNGDAAKVKELDALVAKYLGFDKTLPVSGQTVPRKFDFRIISVLSGIAQSAHRAANDVRIMQHNGEVEEPFSKKQVGSSAMPYKRNPILAERMTALARFLINLLDNTSFTQSAQFLERTLDDSANRRLTIPESFLCVDSILIVYQKLIAGLNVYPYVMDAKLRDSLPFFATENILMESVRHGGDRQELHEVIREFAMLKVEAVRNGKDYDMLSEMKASGKFPLPNGEWDKLGDFSQYVGRAPQQVEEFVSEIVDPILDKNHDFIGIDSAIRV